MNGHSGAIALFDSGLGGLSVLREVRALLPYETIIYYADSAHCPYGNREPAAIRARVAAIAATLITRDAKLLVVACNTATSVALGDLRARFPGIIIVGTEPAVNPAVAATRTGQIAVLATARTVAGEALARLIREHAAAAAVHLVPAPALVALVEAGETTGPRVEAALRPLLDPLLVRGVDTLVLGCTHFPFMRDAINRLAGPRLTVIDGAAAIACRTRDLLESHGLRRPDNDPGNLSLLTSGDPAAVGAIAARLLNTSVTATRHIV